jgi:hypothetical protein
LLLHYSRVREDHDLASKFAAEFIQKLHCIALQQGGDVIMCSSCFMQVIWCGHDTSEDSGHVVCRAAQCAMCMLKAVDDSLCSMKLSFVVSVGALSQVQSGGESGKFVWSIAGAAFASAQRCSSLLRPGAVILTPEAWASVKNPDIISSIPAGSFGARLIRELFCKISLPVSINRVIRPAAQDMLPEWPDRKLALVGMYMCAPLASKLHEPLLLDIFDGTKRAITCVVVCLQDICADFSRSQESLLFTPNTSASQHFPTKFEVNSSVSSMQSPNSSDR